MEAIRNFEELIDHLRLRGDRRRVAVVWASDEWTQKSVSQALEVGFIEAIFVGCQEEVERNRVLMRHREHISFVEADSGDAAAERAVALIHEGKADILMKGMLNTDNLLRAVLNKETGILPQGNVLTHITVASFFSYPKLLFFTDSAVIPYPTQAQRAQQIRYITYAARCFGIKEPRVALIHCSEKVQAKHFPFTAGYSELIERAQTGEFGACIVDGPMDVKTACSAENMRKKGLVSPVGGEADCLVFPDIEAGNMFYKSLTLFAHAETAAVLQGTLCPVVLPSRSDSKQSKFYSLALAAL
ncbi:MAG: phosphate butyryltransferase [Prevotella sp.]|nr:phosphate butyryltransferase [Prevotella sp.]